MAIPAYQLKGHFFLRQVTLFCGQVTQLRSTSHILFLLVEVICVLAVFDCTKIQWIKGTIASPGTHIRVTNSSGCRWHAKNTSYIEIKIEAEIVVLTQQFCGSLRYPPGT